MVKVLINLQDSKSVAGSQALSFSDDFCLEQAMLHLTELTKQIQNHPVNFNYYIMLIC